MTMRLAALLVTLTLMAGTFVVLTHLDLFLVLASIGNYDAAPPPLPARSHMDANMQRGYDLRKGIEAAYARFKAAGPLQPSKDYDLTALVTQYVAAGSPFDGALSILQNAGMTVKRLSSTEQARVPGPRSDAVGSLGLGGHFPCADRWVVSLKSAGVGEHSVTDEVRAGIVVLCL